jgi:GT2 family glycosyltransferase
MVESVRRQTIDDWELLVVTGDDASSMDLGGVSEDKRIRLLGRNGDQVAALARGLAEADGEFIAWISGGDRWDALRLERVLAELSRSSVDSVVDLVELQSDSEDDTVPGRGVMPTWQGPTVRAGGPIGWSPDWSARGWFPELAALVVRRELALEVGGFDPTVHRAAAHDFFLRIAARSTPVLIEHIGVRADADRRQQDVAIAPVRERPSLDLPSAETWHDVVLSRHLVPWDALLEREPEPGVVNVVIPTFQDWRMTTAAVRSVHAAALGGERIVRTIVVDNGSDVTSSVVLASLPLRYPNVEVMSNAVNHGFALGNNLAMRAADGEFVVFLNNDTEVTDGWLEPLIDSLGDPEVLGAQALLLYPDGTIQSAGVAFPSCGGLPHVLLQGFPPLDAAGVSDARFSALTAAAMALRRRDFLAMRGFDALFRNGMEDVDFGLRMTAERDGHFVVRPDSVVVHHESRTPGRFATSLANRRILLDRWRDRLPGDDVDLWSQVGYEVVRHDLGPHVSEDRRLTPPVPILRRFPVITPVDGERPSLRWAIKNPAPNDPSAEFWGDTHFARLLAAALEDLGQQVVIDHRPAFERPSGTFDDVVLVLRGVAPYRPQYGQINLGWLISHPEMLSRHEASSYDRLFAASVVWAAEASRAWGIRVDPLLQATDPARFNPDRARPDTGHPVLFVGSSRRTLRPIVRDAIGAGLPVAIFGREWEGLVPQRYVKAEYLAHEEVGAAYRSAGLVLNDHWEDMRIAGFLSNRLFDAAGSGARVLTDDVAGLGDLFGRSVQVARDEADLARFAALSDLDEVFGDDAERRAVAARVHAEHSFATRAEALLDAAVELWSKLGGVQRRETRAADSVG